jgi:hypothetical protein
MHAVLARPGLRNAATSFCEPIADVNPATWHWFSLKSTDPRPLFAFTGILAQVQWPSEEGGTERRDRDVFAPDHDAALARGDDQSRANAGLSHAR